MNNTLHRSPAWRPELGSPAPEFLLRPSILNSATSSPGEHFFGRTWRLDENPNEEGSLDPSPAVHTNLSPHHQELLPSCPTRQQRRESWGPAVFSPSPVSASPVQVGHSVQRQDCLFPCVPDRQRRHSLGPVICPSPEETQCLQVSHLSFSNARHWNTSWLNRQN